MSGKGVSTALAISNAITNLCATAFGQLWRLEPLPSEKNSMWRREMECLLCVNDHIVELAPSWQTFPDGSKLEVMTCKPRSDLSINLPALCKLDNILVENVSENENEEREFLFSTGENNEEVVEENNEEGGEIDGKAEDNGSISVSECARDVCMEKFVYAKHEVMLPEKQSEFGGMGNGCSEKNIGSRFYSEQLLNIVDCC